MTVTTWDRVMASTRDYRWLLSLVTLGLAIWVFQEPIGWIGGKAALAFGGAVHDLVLTAPLQGLAVVPKQVDIPVTGFAAFYYMGLQWPEFAGEFGTHLRLSLEGIGLSILFALPVGFTVHRLRSLYLPTFILLDAIYALPSLAIFPVLIQFMKVSDAPVLIVLVAYAQFILVRNVFAGLDSIPPEVKEAARGMGMSRAQILLQLEFPLALPVIVAGLRIATVAAIGIASIAALTGIPNLGEFFFDSVRNGGVLAYAEAEAGAVGVIVLALSADLVLRIVEHYVPANRILAAKRSQ